MDKKPNDISGVPSTDDTQSFYNDLVDGKVKRGVWGREKRFDALRITEKASVKKYFTNIIVKYISDSDNVLDIGCGPGGFLLAMQPLCNNITGADVSRNFVSECNRVIKEKNIHNAGAVQVTGKKLPFEDKSFDKVVLVDTIHHMEDVATNMNEVHRVLKDSGSLIIFEPNKLNPLLYLMCVLDKNEWGLLKLGTKNKYKKLLNNNWLIEKIEYNGLLVGPDSGIFLAVAEFLSNGLGKKILGWLSPKIFIHARKKIN